jgi:penicillin G amidase
MVKMVKFVVTLLLTVGLVWVLNKSFNIGGVPAPAFGSFLSPFTGFWQNAEMPLPATFPKVLVNGLKGKAEVVYDDRSVPHIFADSLADALFMQGYLHAKDRLWQMDFATRAASGRLSEVLGEKSITKNGMVNYLEIDKTQRRKGMVYAAENALKGWVKFPATYRLLESYTAGANAYINSLKPKDYPVEFKIMGYQPEAWSLLKTALMMKTMAQTLCAHEEDLETTNAKALLGADFDFVYPQYFKEQSPIVPAGTKWDFTPIAPKKQAFPSKDSSLSFIDFTPVGERPDPGNGSNNWAVSGKKTKSGKPILCGDPHLSLRLPSIWYELQLKTSDMNVYGVSVPGIPCIVIGFNENIAWSETNVGQDVGDWYSIKWTDATKTAYLLDGQKRKADLKIETFHVKSKGDVKDTVRYTVWGPVVYTRDTFAKKDLAFRWLPHDVPVADELGAIVSLGKAKNYKEYTEALKSYLTPAQNFAFACKDGDIALRVTGQFPIRARNQGRFVQDGSLSANAWGGFIPPDHVPFYKNPARGYVSSANQHSTDPSYPYYYLSEGFDAYRGRLVNEKLAKMDSITVEKMMAMQNDNDGLSARENLPLMLKYLDSTALSAIEKPLFEKMKTWNCRYEKDMGAEPMIFDTWIKIFHETLWDEVFADKNAKILLKPKLYRTTDLLKNDIKNKFFDVKSTPAVETASQVLTQTFKQSVEEVTKMMIDPTKMVKTYAQYKGTEVPHLAMMPGFGRKNLENGGQANSINSIKKSHGPSWRMIVEMDTFPRAYVVYPGGISGNPGAKNYDAFLDKWVAGAYYEAIFMRKSDEKNKRIVGIQQFGK